MQQYQHCVTVIVTILACLFSLLILFTGGSPKSNYREEYGSIHTLTLNSHVNYWRILSQTALSQLFLEQLEIHFFTSNVPLAYLKLLSETYPAWLNKSLVQNIRKWNILFQAAKKCKNSVSFQKYRAARNKVIALLCLNKTKFFRKVASAPPGRSFGRLLS